jgi:hypothetical protein
MSVILSEGRKGRRFLLLCDDCGLELVADNREAVAREAKRLGWTEQRPDLCPTCQAERASSPATAPFAA